MKDYKEIWIYGERLDTGPERKRRNLQKHSRISSSAKNEYNGPLVKTTLEEIIVNTL